MNQKFDNTFEFKLIYIFRINDDAHRGCLKIGDATIKTNKKPEELAPNCHELNVSARKRIDEYTSTAGIVYQLLHTELALYKVKKTDDKKYGKIVAFRDYHVHDVLKRSNIKTKYFDTNKKQNEWFIVDLNTAINAIKCVKNEKKSLSSDEITNNLNPIVFRPEQNEAIVKTIKRFSKQDRMLWNAKMRFGKTLSALQVAKEMGFNKTIIVTHRPVVSDGWYDDFKKIFYDKPEYSFGSKIYGEESISKLIKNNKPFVYFASIQDLRGSALVGGKFDKNNEIFNVNWDFIVVDEAHEGTQTNLGKTVLEELIKNKKDKSPKILELSGTPFNLLTDFDEDSIYTWDYIMEQQAKNEWHLNRFGDSNPYEELPKMNIYTYHLEKYITGFMDVEDKAFNFKEFFRIWTGDIKKDGKQIPFGSKIGDFVYEKEIKSFLNLICKKTNETNYPYSTDEYRNFFRHTLWILPGVKEAKAMSKLMKQHHIFQNFDIVNVAGEGDYEVDTSNALKAVKDAMTNHPEDTYTITLSCGRLTTGVSVPEWTAVLMLAGSYSTSAAQYLQTIFRVQTPANINGKIKENCYVFDFAPDRTLKMIAESVQLSSNYKSKKVNPEQQLQLFLNFCPVISVEGSKMKEFKVSMLLQELKKAYAIKVVNNGFDDVRLYNDELLKLDEVDLVEFDSLKAIVGTSVAGSNVIDIEINSEGFNKEEYEKIEKAAKKPKKELTEEEKQLLEELKKKKENRNKAISILRAISIRMPLLVYGMDGDIDTEITIDNFVDLVDDLSWEEFMPKKVDKQTFKKFTKYYDKDVFIACARRIRYIAKSADELEPEERIFKIAQLFSTFKNPDKETVLTPWRVVNMHLVSTIGGYSFWDEEFKNELNKPKYVRMFNATEDVFENYDSKILEINSKTGLYPLFMTFSKYNYRLQKQKKENETLKNKIAIWDKIVENEIYVICKTPMAKSITIRTLLGYRKGKYNMHAFDDLLMQLKDKPDKFMSKIIKKSFWKKGDYGEMKFNAIVGNPPYQLTGGSGGNNDAPIYQDFVSTAIKLKPQYVSMIIPSRWFAAGRENLLGTFRKEMINNSHLRKMNVYNDSHYLFPNVEIKGGVCYFLIDSSYLGPCNYNLLRGNEKITTDIELSKFDIIIREPELINIVDKVLKHDNSGYVESIISFDTPFGISSNPKSPKKKGVKPIDIVSSKSSKYNISIYHIENNKRKVEYMMKEDIRKNAQDIGKVKVFIPGGYGAGETFPHQIIGQPELADVDSVCSQSYLYSSFDTIAEATNFIKYLKTKFFRSLVLAVKITQTASNKVYRYVPLQNFTNNSDINWNLTIDEINNQLYSKYGLDKADREFIEKMIKAM